MVEKSPTKKAAISYQRVSTGRQTGGDKSGIERQQYALKQWLEAHPDYELLETRQEAISGRRRGRFDWLLDGAYPAGTVLVVEDLDRFSRQEVGSGLQLLFKLFDAGFKLAVCSRGFDGEILEDLEHGRARRVVDKLELARDESERKRERAVGAVRDQREKISNGKLSLVFQCRDGIKERRYPWWLDFNPDANNGDGGFEVNDQAAWVRLIFELAKTKGAGLIARELKEQGFRRPFPRKRKRPLPMDASGVRLLLNNRAVLGELQFRDGKNNPVGEPLLGIYPPVITQEQWIGSKAATADRQTFKAPIGSKQFKNLFQGRTFCGLCDSPAGLKSLAPTKLADGSTKQYAPKLRCARGQKDPTACNCDGKQIGVPYDEDKLLRMLTSYRWEQIFGTDKKAQKVALARERLLAAEQALQDALGREERIGSALDKLMEQGQEPPARTVKQVKEAESAVRDCEADVLQANNQLVQAQDKKEGPASPRMAQAKVREFMATGRHDIEKRREFNRWIHELGLALVINPKSKGLLDSPLVIGVPRVQNGEAYLDMTAEDAASLGLDGASVANLLAQQTDRL